VEVALNIGWAPDSAMAQQWAVAAGSETVSGVSTGILNRCVSSYQCIRDWKHEVFIDRCHISK
jgi:hypothetical protein